MILDCTKSNREQSKNRFFLQGDPEAVLVMEVRANTIEEARKQAETLIQDLEAHNMGYHHPIVEGEKTKQVFALRKAGLGLLGNMIGDPKAVACIEDTAVDLNDLPNYIEEFTKIMDKFHHMISAHTNFRATGHRKLHPNYLGRRSGVISMHHMAVGVIEGRGGINCNAREEGCHNALYTMHAIICDFAASISSSS